MKILLIEDDEKIADLVVTSPETPAAIVPLVAGKDVEEAGFFMRIWIAIISVFGF